MPWHSIGYTLLTLFAYLTLRPIDLNKPLWLPSPLQMVYGELMLAAYLLLASWCLAR